MNTNSYLYSDPSGVIKLIEGDKMPLKPDPKRYGPSAEIAALDLIIHNHSSGVYAWKNYEIALQRAKEQAVTVADQEKAKKLIGEQINSLNPGSTGPTFIQPGTIYGPFSLRYEIQNTTIVSQNVAGGMNVDVNQVAILYDNTPPEKEESQRIVVNKVSIPSGSNLVEAYETQHRLIVMFSPGDEIPDDHNCDAMGCGSLSHVKYIFTKPD